MGNNRPAVGIPCPSILLRTIRYNWPCPLVLGGDPPLPLTLPLKAIAISIRLTDASCSAVAYLVNHVGTTLHGPQAVPERVSERVGDNPSGTLGLSHLLMAADAELALVVVVLL